MPFQVPAIIGRYRAGRNATGFGAGFRNFTHAV